MDVVVKNRFYTKVVVSLSVLLDVWRVVGECMGGGGGSKQSECFGSRFSFLITLTLAWYASMLFEEAI